MPKGTKADKNTKFRKIRIYVFRLRTNPDTNKIELGMSKPCNHCTSLLKCSKIKTIHYSTQTQEIVEEKVNNLENDYETRGNLAIKNE